MKSCHKTANRISLEFLRRLVSVVSLVAITAVTMHIGAKLTFTGNLTPAVTELPPASTGLNEVYVLSDINGVTATYIASSASSPVMWYKFSSLGGGYAEPLLTSRDGVNVSIKLLPEDMGYIIEEGTNRFYCWVINYANHRCVMNGLDIAPEQECDRAALTLQGNAAKITYYSITGVQQTLSRDLTLAYNTLKYDAESHNYSVVEVTETLESISGTLRCDAPLCDTEFVLSGDKFLAAWGEALSVTSPSYPAIAVAAETTAEQQKRDNDNEQKVEAGIGGSGPVTVNFSAAVTDAVIYKEWQFSADKSFENIDMRVQELDVERTFTDYGHTYVRFVAGNNAGTCETCSEVYDIYVGESKLLCPNAFSPGASPGVNDEWKVSYQSIIDFDCHIFNRWGVEVAHLTDPSQGWDGRHHGKLVQSGVFYYVIRATGADGKKYKLSGDINVLKSKENTKQ